MVSRVQKILYCLIKQWFSRNISQEEKNWLADQEEKFQIKDLKTAIAVNFENYVEQDLQLVGESALEVSPKHFIEKRDTQAFHLCPTPSKNELAPKKFLFKFLD